MMHPEDQEATTFTTDKGLYCYKVMPFGLKNAGATYQRLVNTMFAKHIGSIVEVYVDDMLVKSVKATGHIANLQIIFDILKQYRMRLNPHKCLFGVAAGRFLGYIEANPDKVRAILDMEPPTTKEQVQCLTGRIAGLSRFISKSTDKCDTFFKLLKRTKCKKVDWSEECEQAFQHIKAYLSSIPLLSTPVPGEMLYMYLSVSPTAVSSVLIRLDGDKELPVFYVAKSLLNA
jgi:hypothetical protein